MVKLPFLNVLLLEVLFSVDVIRFTESDHCGLISVVTRGESHTQIRSKLCFSEYHHITPDDYVYSTDCISVFIVLYFIVIGIFINKKNVKSTCLCNKND